MAYTRNNLNVTRTMKVTQALRAEDWDGNILDNKLTDEVVYDYNVSDIPAANIEKVLRVITNQGEWHQALMQFHFACQSK